MAIFQGTYATAFDYTYSWIIPTDFLPWPLRTKVSTLMRRCRTPHLTSSGSRFQQASQRWFAAVETSGGEGFVEILPSFLNVVWPFLEFKINSFEIRCIDTSTNRSSLEYEIKAITNNISGGCFIFRAPFVFRSVFTFREVCTFRAVLELYLTQIINFQ